jgi:hypothetical protein
MSFCTSRSRSVLKGLAVAVGVLTVAGGGAGAALAAPSVHPVRAASLVPLNKVGPGWSIAEYAGATLHTKATTTLYAVSPTGHKYAFFSWARIGDGPSDFFVVDWSGDGQRVLVSNSFNRLEQISLATGKVISSFKLPADVSVFGYTRPDGDNILTSGPGGIGVRRYDLSGTLQKVLSTTGFNAIESPDGTSVIVQAGYGINQVSNTGGVIKRLHAPVAVSGCMPTRWWNATTVLATCNAKHGAGESRLWLFPINGSRVRALTAQRNGTTEDEGDIDAWQLTNGVYLQALGPCGVEFIATQWHNGSAHAVPVPGVPYPSFHIVTGQGSTLLVQADNGCSAGATLVLFNPHTNKVTWVFHTPKNVFGAESVVPFGRPLS